MEYEKKFVLLDKEIHERNTFDCGEDELNSFLKTKASKHFESRISTTMVLPAIKSSEDKKAKICAFFSVSGSTIQRNTLPNKLAKKLPHYPIPVSLIAQLAVDKRCSGQGLGEITLYQALEFLNRVDDQMRSYAIIVDCLNAKAESFYLKYGFINLCQHNGRARMYMAMRTVKQLFDT